MRILQTEVHSREGTRPLLILTPAGRTEIQYCLDMAKKVPVQKIDSYDVFPVLGPVDIRIAHKVLFKLFLKKDLPCFNSVLIRIDNPECERVVLERLK